MRQTVQASGLRKGFSLVELTMVLIVLGVVAAIGVPRWAAAQSRYQLQHVRQRLERDLLLVQAEARAACADRSIRFDVAANTYELEAVDGRLNGSAVVRLDEEPFGAQLVGISGDNSGRWTFDGNGSFQGGSVMVRVAGEDMTFVVSYTSGAPVRVVELPAALTVDDVVAKPVLN